MCLYVIDDAVLELEYVAANDTRVFFPFELRFKFVPVLVRREYGRWFRWKGNGVALVVNMLDFRV